MEMHPMPLWKGTILLAALAVLLGCQNGKAVTAAPGPKKQEKVPVATAKVRADTAASYFATTSTLQPEARAEVRSRTTGVVRQIHCEEGDQVEAGALLLTLEDDDQKIRLNQARLAAEQAQSEFTRMAAMREKGILSDQDFDLVRNKLKQAEADVEQATLQLSYTSISAPFSGHVVRRLVDPGADITPGTSLFVMMDLEPLLLRIHLPSNRMAKVKKGQKVEIRVKELEPFSGVISLVSPIVDEATGTVKITAEVRDYPSLVRPGDFAEVRIQTLVRPNALLIPSTAVIEEPGGAYVFEAREGRAVRRSIRLGIVESGWSEVVEGLELGLPVVVRGQRNLQDGAEIEVMEEEAPQGDAEKESQP
jgi:membrane fusion protein (multidrug efflux system)